MKMALNVMTSNIKILEVTKPRQKAYRTSLTKNIGAEYGPKNIRCNAVGPGYIMTPLLSNNLSADHLEFSGDEEVKNLANSDVVATVLPGASIGLGMQYAPARKLLDAGCCVSIASDWNPGSAPMGNLLTQASVLATFEKLSMAEVLAAITFRAAKALNLTDRGTIEKGKKADFISFSTFDYRNIIYQQGQLQPTFVWKNGELINL